MASKAVLWIIPLYVLLNISADKASECGSSNVHVAVAIDSTKMTSKSEFADEKQIVRMVLHLAHVKYALVVYTGDNATIYRDFDEDTTGESLESLNYTQSTSYGFDFHKLFALRYNRMPDCLWLLRNNLNYTYIERNLTDDTPMGYDQQIPKIALAFGWGNQLEKMKKFMKFKDVLFHTYNISYSKHQDNLEKIKDSICKHCKELSVLPVVPSLTVGPSTVLTPTMALITTKLMNVTTTIPIGYSTVEVKPSHSTTLPSSTTIETSTTEELMKEYEEFFSFNITQMDLTDKDEIRQYVDTSCRLLTKSHILEKNIPTNVSIGFRVLENLENMCMSVGRTMATSGLINTTMQIQTPTVSIDISAVNVSSFQGFTFGSLEDNDGHLSLPAAIFEGQEYRGTAVIVAMILEPFRSFIVGKTVDGDENTTLAGKVVSVVTLPKLTKPLHPPVTIQVKHSKGVRDTNDAKPSCVFWDLRARGWSTAGCSVAGGNASVTECQCNHMTHYAVLLRFNNEVTPKNHHEAMTIITYIGCSLSIVGVFLTLATFLCLPVLKSERTRIHCNLCVAIGMSQILFLAAGSKELVENTVACKLYAALMFYCFMSVFTWMFVEGVHLYQMVIIAFVSRSMMKLYYAVGWGMPIVIVTIATAITYEGYGTDNFCWISVEGGTIWAFAVPAGLIILGNMAVLVCVLRLRVKLEGSSEVQQTVKTGARVSIVLLPLLGMTWVFGFFSVLPNIGIVFQYLFAITNSLQGFMVFLFHCVGNSEVRKEFHRKADHWLLLRNLSSNNITMLTSKVAPTSTNDADNTLTTK